MNHISFLENVRGQSMSAQPVTATETSCLPLFTLLTVKWSRRPQIHLQTTSLTSVTTAVLLYMMISEEMGDMNHMEQIQYVTDTASMNTKFQSKFVKVHVLFSNELIIDACLFFVFTFVK